MVQGNSLVLIRRVINHFHHVPLRCLTPPHGAKEYLFALYSQTVCLQEEVGGGWEVEGQKGRGGGGRVVVSVSTRIHICIVSLHLSFLSTFTVSTFSLPILPSVPLPPSPSLSLFLSPSHTLSCTYLCLYIFTYAHMHTHTRTCTHTSYWLTVLCNQIQRNMDVDMDREALCM